MFNKERPIDLVDYYKNLVKKQPFDETDHYAMVTGIEVTEEQLSKSTPKPETKPTKQEFGLTWD